jgi:hypothetical protein
MHWADRFLHSVTVWSPKRELAGEGKSICGANGGVARKGNFGFGCEDANPVFAGRVCRCDDEGRFSGVELAFHHLHRLRFHSNGVGKYGKLIPTECSIGEDIEDQVVGLNRSLRT